MYLRQFKKLRLVNLGGNPIAASPDYRSYVLSHIKDLTYLDYRRLNAADVASAIEQHQVQIPVHMLVVPCITQFRVLHKPKKALLEEKSSSA